MAKKRQYHQGKYKPVHPHKYVGALTEITYRSSWELKFMNWCDLNPSVVKWNSEGIVIPYWSQADGKERKYYVDFIIQVKTPDGLKTMMIEIKPEAQTKPPRKSKNQERYLTECHTYQVNCDKWAHAKEWARKNGAEFRVFTEYDLGLAKRK